jgi:hypothetical protein
LRILRVLSAVNIAALKDSLANPQTRNLLTAENAKNAQSFARKNAYLNFHITPPTQFKTTSVLQLLLAKNL